MWTSATFSLGVSSINAHWTTERMPTMRLPLAGAANIGTAKGGCR
jgi:hypothetical protein